MAAPGVVRGSCPFLASGQAEPESRLISLCMSDQLLHSGCLWQARRNPTLAAVICGRQTLSYGDLVQRASLVAKQLQCQDIGRESIVAVLADHSLDAAVGFLGVLLAGGAYLPLDPSQPDERLRLMLSAAEAKTLLIGPNLDCRLASESLARLPLSASGTGADLRAVAMDATPGAEPHSLAYVIFTSGSTGTPRGVMIEHHSATNTIRDLNERFRVGHGDRVLCVSSFGFDLSVYDLFGLWAAGGAVVLPTATEASNPAAYLRLIREHGVTIWNSVPALLDMVVGYAEDLPDAASDHLSSLRLIMLSGDWIPVTLPDRWRKLNATSEVVSLGGATEASIWSILYPIHKVDPAWKSIPYGRAMDGQAIYVLDETMKQTPIGAIGEIYIGGVGVARGYIGRPDLTALRFLPDPYAPAAGTQLYKTGDLGRLMPDGNVEFLGRADTQVKISGHRIELSEIEAVFSRHPQIREAAVIAASGIRNRKRLVAFVVPDGRAPTAQELATFAAQHLPAYMLPARVHFVAALPLTPNGKVDRKQLLAADQAMGSPAASRQASIGLPQPSGLAESNAELEHELVAIWRSVFEREEVGPQDDFFQLGGDSLTAIALAAKIAHRLGRQVGIADLIRLPTVRQLAAFLETGLRAAGGDSGVEIHPGSGGAPLFFAPPIFGDLFGMRKLAVRLPPEWPIIGLQPRGLREGESPDRTLGRIAQHYLDQVRRLQPQGPYHVVGFSFGGTTAFEMANALVASGEAPPLLIMIDAPRRGNPQFVRSTLRLSRMVSQKCFPWLRPRSGGTESPEVLARRDRLFAAHYAALCSYRPKPYHAPAHWLRTLQRPSWMKRVVEDACGTWEWRALLPHSPSADWIPGSHDNLFDPPFVEELAKRISAILAAHAKS